MQTMDGVRAALEAMDREMASLGERSPGANAAGLTDLRASWGKLVEVLALGPAPELRDCPHCGTTGMRAATRCGKCWAKLVPPTAFPSASAT
jgi:hypothetical protein